jgi:RNA polymerase sigma-70 factor (ECF subfamily)
VRDRSTPANDEPTRTDAELLDLIANEHRDALAELYERHAAMVRTAANRITHDPGEAEDLLHDIFLEIWRTASDYQPDRGSVRTWLLVRTRSRSIDRRRHLSRRWFSELPASAGGIALPNAEELTLRSAVTRLPRPLRELLELGYYAGMTCAEMAAALELPLGTVKSRVARALAELRAELAEQ